jgi:hypothetical protein
MKVDASRALLERTSTPPGRIRQVFLVAICTPIHRSALFSERKLDENIHVC